MNWLRPTIQGRERDDHGVSSPWGWRDIGFHHGEDYYWLTGDPINSRACYGVTEGTVSQVFWSDSMGWCVTIQINSTVRVRYCHMGSIAVVSGQRVDSNTYIGHMGATGTEARGEVHLHFEVWVLQKDWVRTDPEPYFQVEPEPPVKKRKKGMTTRYALIGSGDGGLNTLVALAGDVGYPTPGNWDEYRRNPADGSDRDRAAVEFQIHGPVIWLTAEQWAQARERYTTPPKMGTVEVESDPEVTAKLDRILEATLLPREVTVRK